MAVATLASLAAAVPKVKSITAPPTPVILIWGAVSVVAPSYVLVAATVAVAALMVTLLFALALDAGST